MKRVLSILLLILCCSLVAAQEARRPAFRWGLEWGYGVTAFKYWSVNYLDSSVGYRVWDENHAFQAKSTAFACICVGADVSRKANLSMQLGMMGIDKDREVIPVGIRFNYSFRGTDADGPMAFFGGGLGFPDHFTTAAVHYANIGGGYRIRLSSLWDIDFLATFRLCDDHPPVRDPESGEYVNESNIRKNVTAYCSLALGVAITL